MLLKGIQKGSAVTRPSRQPFMGKMFRSLSDMLQGYPFAKYTSLLIKTTMYLAFYGFLRPGEFTCASRCKNYLRKNQLSWDGSCYILALTSTKTTRPGQLTEVKYFPAGNKWCPVRTIREWLQFIEETLGEAPLVLLGSAPLSCTNFLKFIRILLRNIGVDPSSITRHSMRIGEVPAASKQKVPVHVIKKLGRWKSACYARYIPNPQVEMSSAFSNLVLQL